MFKRIFFCLFFFGCFASTVHAQTAPPIDVTVTNTPEVKVINKVQIEDDLEVPQVEIPVVDDVSTIESMIQPLLNWRQSFVSSIVVPSFEGQCPTSSVYIFGRNVRLNAHCTVFSDVAPFLSPACLFFYVCFAGLIILRS
nr:hypothetical protein [uncultured Undibacterium sp.]